jgi:nucleoside-diphosphate-sugar epimerase
MGIHMNHLLCFGFGFSAAALAQILDRTEWQITGTSRSDAGVAAIDAQNCNGIRFDALTSIPDSVTHIVSSVPPDEAGDPVLQKFGQELAARTGQFTRAGQFNWVAYLSTTGVYGDHSGEWVDEETPLAPSTERGHRRLRAEMAWLTLHSQHGLPVQLFRLAGIYGPGRNQLEGLKKGTARRVIKPGQIFSRIHVSDIAGILEASMARPNPGRAYNVADDLPAPPQDVVAYAAKIMALPLPPEEDFASANLSSMARSFYAESKRVSNARVKSELGYQFKFPDYRAGLADLLRTLSHPPAPPSQARYP